MPDRSRVAIVLSKANLLLTGIAVLLVAVDLLARMVSSSMPALLDQPLFAAVWLYLLVTPVIGVVGLALGDRSRRLVRANYWLLLVWLGFLIYTIVAPLG